MKKPILVLFLSFFILTACNIPRDPEDSFEQAQELELRVGVIDNLPFSTYTNDEAEGKEVEIVKNFAEKYNLKISFIPGNESDLIKKLEEYELHIVIGGFDKKTIWKSRVGMTSAYDEEHLLLIPKGENKLVMKLDSYLKSLQKNEK